ncbi:MAG: hypothetical protein HY795_07355 [Desulfovibrio sp.]|nr:hypothetical protein [Desulfovibrio sp.]MBI4960811.1 hypothetical protein [Desulfovibrio sp.]
MVFLNFLKGLGLDLETFCPFDIEVVNAESGVSCDDDIESVNSFHKDYYANSMALASGDELQMNRVQVDQASNVQSSAPNMVPNDRSCSDCDFCQPDEDFETGSDGMRCSVMGFVIADAKQCASTCSSYYCPEPVEDM